jgi:hypothetical protein
VNEEAQLEKPCVGVNVCAVVDCDPYTGEAKANFTLEQATKAQRGSGGIALFFLYPPRYAWERPGTHCIGGRVGPRAGLVVCRKSRTHRDSIPGPSSP